MNSLMQDFRYGVRQLRRSLGFTTIAILTIALGIGSATAMFSVVNAVLLRPLPFRHADRLVAIAEYDTRHGVPKNATGSVSYPNMVDLRTRNRSLTDVAVYGWSEETITGRGEPRHVGLSRVNASLFKILDAQPYLGRTFTADEDQPGHYPVVLSYQFWRTYFSGNKDVIGRNINLNGRPYHVVGVMPAGFQFPITSDTRDLWITVSRDAESDSPGDTPVTAQRGAHMFNAIARLRDGVTIQQANADISSIAQALTREYPNSNSHSGILAVSELQFLVGDVRTPLLILLVAVGLVLLIACVNVANLLLVRGSDRLREIGIRAALGASRLRLMRQLMMESILLSIAGAALGIFLASCMISGVLRLYPENLPRADQVGIDLRVLLFSTALAIVTGILFGLVPSFQIAPISLVANIRAGDRTSTSSRGHNRLRSGLVIAETAVGVMLLIGAGLLLRSLHRLAHVDLGLDPNHLLTASFDLSETRYKPDQQDRFVHDLLARLNSLPGVVGAAGALPLPLSNDNWGVSFNLMDHPVPEANQPSAAFYLVTPGFFETMKMPLVRGRFFDERDQRNSAPVMVISGSFAKQYFPHEDPIGRKIEIGADEGAARAKYKIREVVGIVGDLRINELERDPPAAYYIPLSQLMFGTPTLVLRTQGEPMTLTTAVGKTLREMDADAPLYNVKTMNDYLALDLGRESLLYEIPPRDPMTYVGVCVVLGIVALLASYIPALRATRLDPMVALRYE
ncbi:MAG TPA: ABC transporter permease [Terriglobales bacterium]|nr:ABC transporter permease [Terriglobales bacterium]